MHVEIQIKIEPQELDNKEVLGCYAARTVGVEVQRIKHIDIIKKAVDARQRIVMLNLTLGVHIDQIEEREKIFVPNYKDVSMARPVIIIGAGPAGLFAALKLIEKGLKPIVLERGQSVENRRKDLALLYKTGIVNDNSNFGFGEGGAGTFSDGKLYTRSKKRGDVQRAMEILVYHGASESILIDSHPHLGTDKLPLVIVNIRKTIERYGGEVHFDTRVSDLILRNKRVEGVIAGDKEFLAENVILATGHSARDVYQMLNNRAVYMEAKDFAVGLRLEHPQHVVDCMQYHNPEGRGKYLPAAEYNFVTNINQRGVYSFCMCPGGVVVPAATGSEQQVVNGMSASGRNTPWANAAIVTSIGSPELVAMGYEGVFGGMEFQMQLERAAWKNGGGNLRAPGQVLTDFIKGKYTNILPSNSYKPGVTSSMLNEWLPSIVYERLKNGIISFGHKAREFVTEEALLLGVETRTSSPLRIPRQTDRCMHVEIEGLYPCGEGAGYAGGIISAAMDGEKCAESIL